MLLIYLVIKLQELGNKENFSIQKSQKKSLVLEKDFLPKALRIASSFDAFQDNPWPLIYKDMHKKYPGNKFIITPRDHEDWWSSIYNHFSEKSTPMRQTYLW